MEKYKLSLPCLFGLESVVADEVRRLGYETDEVSDGRITFFGDGEAPARANLWLRSAERVQIELASFRAESFDELFEGVKKIDWAAFLPRDAAFPVTGHALKSQLSSVPDCQKIVKKAIVEKLKLTYRTDWFSESGAVMPVQFIIMKNIAKIYLDTSGEGLHKRGYRQKANAAPLRETMAAAMVYLARYRAGQPFWDPLCGSGTIVIEAAMMADNIAPGLRRKFGGESYAFLPQGSFERARAEALDAVKNEKFTLIGTDRDPEMKALAARNAELAGVAKHTRFETMDVAKLHTEAEGGIVICNPPYGERLLDRREAETLYRLMGKVFCALPNWKYYIVTSDEEFEKYFGKKADKKRKLYNGMIKCDFYQYFKHFQFPKTHGE